MNDFLLNFLTVGEQVLVLFLLIAIGFLCNKGKLLSKEANKRISDLVVIVVAPCVIIKSFLREFNPDMLKLLLLALLIAAVSHVVMFLLSYLLIRDKNEQRKRVLQFGSIFSNAGFIALPLQEALLGTDGVFFGAAYVVMFNIFAWSWGICLMTGDQSKITVKKILFSPGIIGVVIGMILFVTSVKLPNVIATTLTHISNLNTPLPMIVVGYYLAETNLLHALKDKGNYLCIGIRLIAFPLLALAIMYLCGVRDAMLISMAIAMSAPVGAMTTMFSEKFGSDTVLSVQLVSLSTLFSMVTMPVIVALAKMIA
ncbi:MAG: AEC family transporter [Clostridia bacterium]|nr:AEC family transporter [Clostridia bacterium]